MNSEVTNNEKANRFEIDFDGSLARLDYELSEGIITLTHTEVPDALEGEGIGSKIVRHALDHARSNGLKVIPECPFVSSYIDRHQEYAELLAE